MGTLATTIHGVTTGVGSLFGNALASIKSGFQTVVGDVTAWAEGIYAGDVTGINMNRLDDMKNAVENYCQKLEQHLDAMQTSVKTDEAFAGGYAEAVTEFLGAIKDCCYAIINNLREFKKKLDEVGEKYSIKNDEVASSLTDQAQELRSRFGANGMQ